MGAPVPRESALPRAWRIALVYPAVVLAALESLAIVAMVIVLLLPWPDVPVYAAVSAFILFSFFAPVLALQVLGLLDGLYVLRHGRPRPRRWLRVSWEVLLGAMLMAYLLGFSMGEDGWSSPLLLPATAAGFVVLGWVLVLLPRADSRGEGEPTVRRESLSRLFEGPARRAATFLVMGVAVAVAWRLAPMAFERGTDEQSGFDLAARGVLCVALAAGFVVAFGTWLIAVVTSRRTVADVRGDPSSEGRA